MRLHRDRFFFVARVFWLVCAIFFWVFWLSSVPRFLQRAGMGTLPTAVVNGLSPALVASERASAWGASFVTWSWINVAVTGLSVLMFSLVAFHIWWRLRTGFGLLTAFVLLVGSSGFMSVVIYSAENSATAVAAWELGAIIWPLFFLWLYLYPNGQAVPRRLLWVLGPLLSLFALPFLVHILTIFLGNSGPLAQPLNGIESLVELLAIPLFMLVLGAQVYRYVKVSGAVEREQTKWFLLGLAIAFLPRLLLDLATDYPAELDTVVFIALPIGIGISILRYRLWDIDVIIRRTLQYALLTGLLALVYFGSVVLLQSLAENVTGRQSPIVIVVSTLAIAALFNPLRLRVQRFIDRHFFRRKYDAAQTLAAFAAIARDEVDLDRLTVALLGVVEETMQPERASLWLRTERVQELTRVQSPHRPRHRL